MKGDMTQVDRISFSEAARRLDVSRSTIADIVDKHGITPKQVGAGRGQGRSKGLDSADLGRIRQALNMDPEPAAAT